MFWPLKGRYLSAFFNSAINRSLLCPLMRYVPNIIEILLNYLSGLKVIIDSALTLDAHVKSLIQCSKIIFHAFILPLFTCLNKTSSDHLQFDLLRCFSHVTPLLILLQCHPINFRLHFQKIVVLTCTALHGQAPTYITELLHPSIASEFPEVMWSRATGCAWYKAENERQQSFCSSGSQTLPYWDWELWTQWCLLKNS